ncbi:hypothetical protein B9Z65_6842 [Elsinoe australis]|uniref:Major facilitator superfamily (MFS) profile domain-containing protein n=1 Tax=Elsinoe australis TaxID=40998 RepID=A0A2P7Z3U3_9PEZI|nr:hypothetical protein B9Z65_6842 [Elsinoe australis]
MEEKKFQTTSHVEDVKDDHEDGLQKQAIPPVMGTVKLTEDVAGSGKIVYIPTPSADPRDPLNLKPWHKNMILVLISLFSCLGLSLVSGLGGLLSFYIPEYAAAGKGYADITALMTYPTLFMGISNLIGIPLAYAVGRRIVFLTSCVILVASACLCAEAKSYEWHLGARMVLGIAAGQSEALVPLVTQEIFFLHERGTCLMIQNTIQTITCAVWVLLASPIAAAITPRWWYYLGAILAAVVLVLSVFLLPETKYTRSVLSYQNSSSYGAEDELKRVPSQPIICTERPPLDLSRYEPRTLKSDMRLWVDKPDWKTFWLVYKHVGELLLFPNVLFALLLNGLTLGVNVAIGTTYGNILHAAPYNWPQSSISYANCGQIVTALAALPILGMASDVIIKYMAKRNNGVHEPENRLLTLPFPIIVGVFTAVLYGQGATNPAQYHWFLYCWAIAAYYFAFLGANIVAITYLLDSYPARAGPLLVIICAFRGIISFGVSYGIAPFIETAGFDGAFGAFGGMTALFGMGFGGIFFCGKAIRRYTGRFIKDATTT